MFFCLVGVGLGLMLVDRVWALVDTFLGLVVKLDSLVDTFATLVDKVQPILIWWTLLGI